MDRRLLACVAGALLSAASAPALDWNDPPSVVAAAIMASPSLREIEANLNAARAQRRAAGALPNPMLMAGVQDQQIDLSRDPMMTMYMVGASQTFVRGERREASQRAAQLSVERLEHEAESRRAEIARDVLIAYNEAAAANNEIAANDEIAKLAAMMSDAARVRYEVGATAQSDIIRAKVEASNIRHAILMQRGVRDSALARLRERVSRLPGHQLVVDRQERQPALALGPGDLVGCRASAAEERAQLAVHRSRNAPLLLPARSGEHPSTPRHATRLGPWAGRGPARRGCCA